MARKRVHEARKKLYAARDDRAELSRALTEALDAERTALGEFHAALQERAAAIAEENDKDRDELERLDEG